MSSSQGFSEPLPGYMLARLTASAYASLQKLEDFYDLLIVWEEPRRHDSRYVVSADVSSGIGEDRCCVDVTRVPTVREPAEQVAQFVSLQVDPLALAYVVDAVGRYYTGEDGQEAMAAVEVNGLGVSTVLELQQHLAYSNIYVRREPDEADPTKLTTKIGWNTSKRTRPLILGRYARKVRTVDPNTMIPDYKINSPFTIEELRDFRVPEGKLALWEGEAAPGSYDDCMMAGAIGIHVADTLAYETGESVDDKRRRLAAESARRQAEAARTLDPADFRNTDWTDDEAHEFDYYSADQVYDDGMGAVDD